MFQTCTISNNVSLHYRHFSLIGQKLIFWPMREKWLTAAITWFMQASHLHHNKHKPHTHKVATHQIKCQWPAVCGLRACLHVIFSRPVNPKVGQLSNIGKWGSNAFLRMGQFLLNEWCLYIYKHRPKSGQSGAIFLLKLPKIYSNSMLMTYGMGQFNWVSKSRLQQNA